MHIIYRFLIMVAFLVVTLTAIPLLTSVIDRPPNKLPPKIFNLGIETLTVYLNLSNKQKVQLKVPPCGVVEIGGTAINLTSSASIFSGEKRMHTFGRQDLIDMRKMGTSYWWMLDEEEVLLRHVASRKVYGKLKTQCRRDFIIYPNRKFID